MPCELAEAVRAHAEQPIHSSANLNDHALLHSLIESFWNPGAHATDSTEFLARVFGLASR